MGPNPQPHSLQSQPQLVHSLQPQPATQSELSKHPLRSQPPFAPSTPKRKTTLDHCPLVHRILGILSARCGANRGHKLAGNLPNSQRCNETRVLFGARGRWPVRGGGPWRRPGTCVPNTVCARYVVLPVTPPERRRRTPYETHELRGLAITAVTQSYLVVVAGLVAQFFTELLLRRQPGFSDDTVHDAAVRYFGGAAGALLAYLVGRSVPVARRRPFLEANVLMIIVVAILARAGHHAGGAEGPYSVSFCTVLFCWSLIMPGGARYAAFPILGGLFTFYAVLFLSGGRGFFDVRTTAFAIFTTTSAGFSLLYAEVLERWRERVSLAVTTDPLTQLLSRAYVLERLATLLDPKRSPRASP
jgi:hypothetical protein